MILGGASAEETDSGLFVYSTFPFLETKTVKSPTDSNSDTNKSNENNTIIQKKNWNKITKKFDWVTLDKLLSDPRIVSQARTLYFYVLTYFCIYLL